MRCGVREKNSRHWQSSFSPNGLLAQIDSLLFSISHDSSEPHLFSLTIPTSIALIQSHTHPTLLDLSFQFFPRAIFAPVRIVVQEGPDRIGVAEFGRVGGVVLGRKRRERREGGNVEWHGPGK